MKRAQSPSDADAMEMKFPCRIHGMLKTDSFTGVIRPDKAAEKIAFNVPVERRVNETVALEALFADAGRGDDRFRCRISADYPYGCTEQTLNRFLPTVITATVCCEMKLPIWGRSTRKHRNRPQQRQEVGDDRMNASRIGNRLTHRNPGLR